MSSSLTSIGLTLVILFIPLILVIGVLSIMWRTWWLYPAWAWFLVPLGAPPISFWHFAGLLALFSALTSHIDDRKDDRKTDYSKLGVVIVWPMFTWVILWWLK